jgi:stringent starvation protein B
MENRTVDVAARIEVAELAPQRISVPEGTVLQIYARDAHGNKMLMSLPGPVDISMVPIEQQKLE